MTEEAYRRGPIMLPPFGRGARIVLGVVWTGYLLFLVFALWLRQPWAATLALDPLEATIGLQPWRLVTYVFVNEPLPLILTSVFVWFLSGDLEARWGTAAYLKFSAWMVAAGALGALLVLPIGLLAPPGSLLAALCGGVTTGPHAFVFGLSAAWGAVYPDRMLYLLFFIPVRGRWLLWIGLGIEALLLLAQQLTLNAFLGSIVAGALGWLLVTGKWRPSRWRRARPKPVGRARGAGGLRVIRGGRGRVDDDDEDDDDGGSDDGLPPKPKYLN